MAKPEVVYGGPYANEAEAITAESQKENPNYDGLTENWKTISQGALNYIEQVQKPVEAPVGVFINNVEEEEKEEVEIPAVVPFIASDEVASDPEATVETAPEGSVPFDEESEEESDEESEEESTVTEEEQANFDKELGL